LVLEDKGLRNYGTDAARTEQAGQGNKEMDKQNDQIAHRRIVAGREIWAKQQFASHRGLLNLPRYSYRCKATTDIPSPKTARSRLARFSAASITNTGGKGSPREGREELRGRWTLIASPQFLVAVRPELRSACHKDPD
jgi:hypothetical protein